VWRWSCWGRAFCFPRAICLLLSAAGPTGELESQRASEPASKRKGGAAVSQQRSVLHNN